MIKNDQFKWTTEREKAAEYLAEGVGSEAEVARRVGVRLVTIRRWREHPAFQEKINERKAAILAALQKQGITNKQNRLDHYNDRHARMRRVIDERATDPAMRDVPGGETGLLVHTVKVIGGGKNAQHLDEYAVDTGLLKEMREVEKQAAVEMGQLDEKPVSGDKLIREYVGVDVSQV